MVIVRFSEVGKAMAPSRRHPLTAHESTVRALKEDVNGQRSRR